MLSLFRRIVGYFFGSVMAAALLFVGSVVYLYCTADSGEPTSGGGRASCRIEWSDGQNDNGDLTLQKQSDMYRIFRKTIRYFLWFLVIAGVLSVGALVYLYYTADMGEPTFDLDTSAYRVVRHEELSCCGGSTLRRNPAGLWELTTGGDPVVRGAESGALLDELMYYQERVFVDEICRIVPSKAYLHFLRTLIVLFNRNMATYVSEEYRREIAAQARFCSHEFDAIGTPYERQINYHAAHDIGHAMQEYMLVGCSSFAVWDAQSADSTLLVGRNFDFWVGDDFARNKLVTFCRPDKGHSFASVGWPGMCGVLSGMNAEGLTVTLNAAKGPIPTRVATPVSLLARTILQYASTIDEALAIADTTRTFVSESLLIASAHDGRAAIIEKTPCRTVLYMPDTDRIRCTNHYQSDAFADDHDNQENIATTDSSYRFERLGELMDGLAPLDPERVAAILRDRRGLRGVDIGLTNEKSINQSIAHHAVIFQPEKLRMWVSTEPWQAGPMVCYDLRRIFAERCPEPFGCPARLDCPEREIAADERFMREDHPRIVCYRKAVGALREAIRTGACADATVRELLESNPRYFGAWDACGDYYAARGEKAAARRHWQQSLELEIPRTREREAIERKIDRL